MEMNLTCCFRRSGKARDLSSFPLFALFWEVGCFSFWCVRGYCGHFFCKLQVKILLGGLCVLYVFIFLLYLTVKWVWNVATSETLPQLFAVNTVLFFFVLVLLLEGFFCFVFSLYSMGAPMIYAQPK